MPFEFLEHMADVYVKAYGRDLKEVFESAAKALFEVMINTEKVDLKEEYEVTVEGMDLYQLLYNWLEELLIIFTSQGLAIGKTSITDLKCNGVCYLKAKVYGEKYSVEKHEARTEVKSPTYSLMEIRVSKDFAEAKFVLDI
ncbi:MAG: hypothetical protein DRJ31_04580 [Candidatus Methanomethylicota archaeon]|uniref:Protein archease n=1 Tax=Thermoproteota archaeon TaxID=2056631 RepID=A0A497EQ79_9CREN|nr:MAG: hypothetical protein DRJ31_04580 [Candidatus Verstraetearchaeota archaeon]